MSLPQHLAPLAKKLAQAFPGEIIGDQYFALLNLLEPHTSMRTLAAVMAEVTGRSYAVVFNDVLGVETRVVPADEVKQVKDRLQAFGILQWLRDQDVAGE